MKKRFLMMVSIVLIAAMFTLIFAACIPSDYAKAQERLEKKGYQPSNTFGAGISFLNNAFNDNLDGKLLKTVIETKDNEGCTIYYYSLASDAKKVYKQLKEDYKDDKDYVVKRSGKAVFVGTKQAWKDL